MTSIRSLAPANGEGAKKMKKGHNHQGSAMPGDGNVFPPGTERFSWVLL
jgi:hypothetical protein